MKMKLPFVVALALTALFFHSCANSPHTPVTVRWGNEMYHYSPEDGIVVEVESAK